MGRSALSGLSAPVTAFDLGTASHGASLLVGGVPDIILHAGHIIAGTPHADDDDQRRKEYLLEHNA